jgi:hypothetical protein
VDVEGAFFRPSASQAEVSDTLVRVAGHTLLISAYFDASLDPNPNLKRDFPHIPWRGEISVLFVGKRKSFVRRAPPDPVVRSAVARCVLIKIGRFLGTQELNWFDKVHGAVYRPRGARIPVSRIYNGVGRSPLPMLWGFDHLPCLGKGLSQTRP